LDPVFAANPAGAACPALAPAEPLLDVALTIPAAPPPITAITAPRAMGLVSLWVRICNLLRVYLQS
jgi:hypothetical protein